MATTTEVLYTGIEFRRRLTVRNATSQALESLSGKTVTVQLKRKPVVSPLATADVTLLAQSGGTLGQADVVIPAEDTAALSAGPAYLLVIVDGQLVTPPVRVSVQQV